MGTTNGPQTPVPLPSSGRGAEPTQGHFRFSPDLFCAFHGPVPCNSKKNHEQDHLRVALTAALVASSLQEIPYPFL